MHIKGKYSWLKHLDFLILDVFALIVSFCIAYIFKFKDLMMFSDAGWKFVLTLACMLDLVIIMFTNTFSGIIRRYGSEEFLKLAIHTVYNLLFLSILLYAMKMGAAYSRIVIFATYIIYFFLSFTLREVWKQMLRSGKASSFVNEPKSIFVVGDKENMSQLLSSINSGFLNAYRVKGICITDGTVGEKVTAQIEELDSRGRVKDTILEFTNSAEIEHITDYVLENRIEEVYVGVKPSTLSKDIYKTLMDNGKIIHLGVMPMVGFRTEDQFITTVGTYKALTVGAHSFTGEQMIYQTVKRAFDVFFGLLGTICLLPLMLVVKISYLATGDKKSIFYTHTRIGLNGQPFKMYKFRSMVWNSAEILEELLKDPKYAKEWKENQKFEDDPRITKMGKFLRKTSLDEIPQFINVLLGDMSVIGPRPLVPGELEEHGGLQLYNHVKPGITGWWGCNGRSNTTYDERLELEYYYVKNSSLYLDALCVIKTIAVILKREGAK